MTQEEFKSPTYEQVQRVLDLLIDCTRQNLEMKNHIDSLIKIAKIQSDAGEETKAAIELLFSKIIELEQAITDEGIEIPRIQRIVN
jgi:histone H3/H4